MDCSSSRMKVQSFGFIKRTARETALSHTYHNARSCAPRGERLHRRCVWVESASLSRSHTAPSDPSEHPPTYRKHQVLMSAGKMHVDEVDVDVSLVGRLLTAQFPQRADLPIEPVHSAGTDNAIYRVGSD